MQINIDVSDFPNEGKPHSEILYLCFKSLNFGGKLVFYKTHSEAPKVKIIFLLKAKFIEN